MPLPAQKPTSVAGELDDLALVFKKAELADIIGVSAATFSPSRKGRSSFRRDVADLIDALWDVTALAMRAQTEDLVFFLRSRREELGWRSPAEMLREEQASELIRYLITLPTRRGEAAADGDRDLEALGLELAGLGADTPPTAREQVPQDDDTVTRMLSEDGRLGAAIEGLAAAGRRYFPDLETRVQAVWDYESDDDPQLLLELVTSMRAGDANRALGELLEADGELLDPVFDRLTVTVASPEVA